MIRVTIDFGYDIHHINVDDLTYRQIKSGKKVEVDGQGFTHEEDGHLVDHWKFNDTPGDACFRLDNGAEFRADDIWFDENP